MAELLKIWQGMKDKEDKDGCIPLPIIDTLRIYRKNKKSILVICSPTGDDKDIDTYWVKDSLPPSDFLTINALHQILEAELNLNGKIKFIEHLGGLDYTFSKTMFRPQTSLSNLPLEKQPVVWSLLYSMALIYSRHIDFEASTPKKEGAIENLTVLATD